MSPRAITRWFTIGSTAIGAVLMTLTLVSQGAGWVSSTGLPSLQASAAIALFGTCGITIGTMLLQRTGWRSLRWGLLDSKQQGAVLRIASGSFLVNICGPTATALLGSGPAATATTLGSMLVGTLNMLKTKASVAIMMRMVVVVGVLLSTQAVEGHLNIVGAIAATGAAVHFWLLPGALKTLGDRSNHGMVLANIIATPFVVATAVLVMVSGDVLVLPGQLWMPWSFGAEQWRSMFVVALLVMVIPVFLTNAAARRLSKENVAAMQAMSAPVYALVAVGAALLGFAAAPSLVVTQWLGFAVVLGVGFCAVKTSAEPADSTAMATVRPAPAS